MRMHPEENNAIIFAESPQRQCCMTSVVVKNEETFAHNCLLSCMLLKMLDPL